MKSSVEIVVDPGVGDRGASVTVTVSQEEGIMSVRVEERHQTPYRDKWWLQPIEGLNKEGKFGGERP